jgi:predicted RNA-binding Zn ribbon-like protein
MSLELVRDYVNTLDVESGTDAIETPAGLVEWLSARRLCGSRARAGARDVREAVAMREALRTLLIANNEPGVETAASAAVLDRAARRAGVAIRFGADGRASLRSAAGGVRGALGGVLAAAAAATASDDWLRLKACRAGNCRWAFIDQARNRSRAWCSMDVCGNRRKAQRYRERHVVHAT